MKKVCELYSTYINNLSQKKISKKTYTVIFSIIFLISLIPLLIVAKKSFPSTDDITYSVVTKEAWEETHSVLKVLSAAVKTDIEYYYNWGGGYISAFILSLQPAIFGEKYYGITPLLLIIAISISVFVFTDYIIRKLLRGDRFDVLFIASAMIYMMFQGMPGVQDSLFWYTGAMSYGLFWAIYLLFAFFLVKYQFTNKASVIIPAAILGFISEGANYITGISVLMLSFGFIVYNYCIKNKKVIPGYIIVLVISVTGFIMHVLAPGTAARFEAAGTGYNPLVRAVKTIISSICHAMWRISEWTDLKTIYILLIALPIMAGIIYKAGDKLNIQFKNPLLLLIISVIWLCILYCPPYYALGFPGTDRLESVVYFTYVVFLFINEFYIIGWIYKNNIHLKIWTYLYEIRGTVALVSLIALVLLITGSRNNAYWSLKAVIKGQEILYLTDFNEFIK